VLYQAQGVTLKDLCLQHGESNQRPQRFLGRSLALLPRVICCLERVGVARRAWQNGVRGAPFFDQIDAVLKDVLASGNQATNEGGWSYWALCNDSGITPRGYPIA